MHPAGTFLLEKNIGRDVSKYFDGGYIMENSGGHENAICTPKPCNHSF